MATPVSPAAQKTAARTAAEEALLDAAERLLADSRVRGRHDAPAG